MSLAQKYLNAFSTDRLIGNTNAYDDSAAPQHRQKFFNSLNAGSDIPAQPNYSRSDIPSQPNYYVRFPLIPDLRNLRTQPFDLSGFPEDVFSNVFSNATQAKRNIDLSQAVDYQNQINKAIEFGPTMLNNALAGRLYNYF
jgi:hypothetical protein